MVRSALASCLLGIALAGAAGAAGAPDTAAVAASKATNTTVREIGAAMYFWAVDVAGERDVQGYKGAATESVRWSDCPPLSYEEAQRLLVPKYIAELPRTDAWGHPLELCMNREGVKAHAYGVLGVRSPGADGRFDGDTYSVGPFDRKELDHDVVWLDGYFMRWPMAL